MNHIVLCFSIVLAMFLTMGQATVQGGEVAAKVVAIDQNWEWNRFGSFNPAGMMYALERDVVLKDGASTLGPGNVMLRPDKRPRPLVLRANVGDTLRVRFTNLLGPRPNVNAPATRNASMAVSSVTTLGDPGIVGIAPGAVKDYSWRCDREGAFLIWDNASPSGGEGDGGSLTLGLFGALVCEPAGSKWYRSQVTADELKSASAGVDPASGHPLITADGYETLNILSGGEIIHSDLNAMVVYDEVDDGVQATTEGSFREFVVVFHDEIKAVQAYDILNENQMAGVRDGFAINYGASGMGAMLIANRTAEGPAKNCVECAYEEFFLTSWANGDPALLPQYADDPSNVHHSYLNDNVRIRNIHAGPKETHVFHLHAHQWLAQLNGEKSSYLDSQTIAPFQSFDYEILYGGSGNRNKTVGDAIFHCHLYPHFAQGMWALWRIHDVFEDGTRRLPDGELGAGTDPLTGQTSGGTPIPAVVPLPHLAMAPMPTYSASVNNLGEAEGFPGYPFYIAGKAGHRPPQPPLDLVSNAGLPRHVFKDGDVINDRLARTELGAVADMTVEIHKAQIDVLPDGGTPLEKAAMKFHANAAGYSSSTPDGTAGLFLVNGKAPQPGAPFADPCPENPTMRSYSVSAIQLDLVVNRHGWHDPQARINVLDSDVASYENRSRTADPFFFRANSGECIEFKHTNRTPHHLKKDDFQVATPTDTIGQHIHLVKFDVTSSDGSGNGWNYEDGTLAKDAVDERLKAVDAAKALGLPAALDSAGNPVTLPGAALGYQTTVQRWWADPLLNKSGDDRTIRTVFTHDHFGPSSIQQHGFYAALVIEPAGSKWLKPDGTSLANGVGTQAMIVDSLEKTTIHPDHREFMVAIQDFALLYDRNGKPIDPPLLPEAISVEHHDPHLVNYKHEPMPLRVFNFNPDGTFAGPKNGKAGDMAYVFDSRVHGDPFTEIFKAFEGERVQFRLIQGAQEVQHVWTVNGLRWKREVSNSDSRYVGSQEIGISEHFEAEIPNLGDTVASSADYLYHFGTTGSLWNGAWGFLRAYTNPRQARGLTPLPGTTGTVRVANNRDFLGNGCPKAAPMKIFNVEAWAARDLLSDGGIVYNRREGIADPTGLMYILAEDRAAFQASLKKVEPLVIRANAGDCIQVNLTNFLPQVVPDLPGDAILPKITAVNADNFLPSNKVSIHPQLLSYDVRRNDGANIGLNQPQTANVDMRLVNPRAKSETVTYTWYAGVISLEPVTGGRGGTHTATWKPEAFGTIPLRSFGDVIKQGSQGLIGALIIEPESATWTDPAGNPISSGTAALVKPRADSLPEQSFDNFSEFVLLYQDGMNLRWNGGAIPDCLVCDDTYDTGEKGLNYRTEPHWARLHENPATDLLNVEFPAAWALGPIETPVFEARAGERVMFRVAHPEGRARQRTFNVMGHDYLTGGLDGFLSGGSGLLAPGRSIDAELTGGAKQGTWLYRDGTSTMYSGGVWGHFVVQ